MKCFDEKWIERLRTAMPLEDSHLSAGDEALEACLVELRRSAESTNCAGRRLEATVVASRKTSFGFGKGALAVVAVAVLLGLVLRSDFSNSVGASDEALADSDSQQVMSELEALFDAQLVGVVMDWRGMDIQLAEGDGRRTGTLPSTDQRVCLVFDDAGKRITALGYSGRSIRLSIDGESVALMPLVNVDDEVIVVAEDDVFDGRRDNSVGVLKVVHAHRLERGLQPERGGAGRS